MRRLFSLPLLCLALFFGLTACDSGGSNGGGVNNEFSMDVTPKSSSSGSVNAKAALRDTTISGFSFFYSGQNSDGEDAFGLYLSGNESFDNPQQGLFGFFARNSRRPGTGSYNLVSLEQEFDSGNFIGVLYEDFGGDFRDAPFYVPQGGTVDLNTSNDDEVSGTVTIPTAYAITFDLTTTPATVDTTEVRIEGSFTAKNVDNFVPLATPSN